MGKKQTIHTTLSDKAINVLEKYQKLLDVNGIPIYPTKTNIIEEALELLDNHYNPSKNDLQTIWNRAKKELNMVLVGKKTFLAYISGDFKRAFQENIALEIVEWYQGKFINEMNLEDLLNAIKNVWLAANYFYKIDIEKGSKGSYQISFYHDFHSKEYSEYWGNYFSVLLQQHKKCEVEMFARNESLTLRIA